MNDVYDEILGDLERFPSPDEHARSAIAARAATVLRPTGALARLDDVAVWLAGWQRTTRPAVEEPAIVVFVGDHGITEEGVSAYPGTVTAAMLRALNEGVATAAVFATALGAHIHVVDTGVDRPTANFLSGPALDPERFRASFEAGRTAVADLDTDLLVLGEMGIGNTTSAAAVCACLFGLAPEDWVGRGTGIDDATLARKTDIVARARARVGAVHPLEVLSEVGGTELVALAGAALEARLRSLPVVLDGFVVTAALAALEVARHGALDHCIAGHCSPEPGHRLLLDKLGKRPLLDLDLRLGEGSGALLAVPLIALAAKGITDVATFEEWGLT